MATRTGSAVWDGTLKQGKGTMKLGSGAFEGPYSFSSRFEEGKGTNPEELIGAAEAGCFSMALSFNLEKAGHPAKRLSTTATVNLESTDGGFKITSIDLKTEADVPGIDQAKFREQAELTKKTCPVSVALAGTKINLEAKLLYKPPYKCHPERSEHLWSFRDRLYGENQRCFASLNMTTRL